MSGNAEKVTHTDSFKDGESKFGFEATATKKNSVILDGEYLVLSSKKGDYKACTRFPVIARKKFKISYKLLFPKLDEEHIFGLVFNYDEDEDIGDILYITENTFYICDADGDKLGKKEKIKLKKGKNVEVNVDIEKKGEKTIISINGVEFENLDIQFKTSYMGFYVNEKNTLKVDEIKITQYVED
jgi:hypothetical protein